MEAHTLDEFLAFVGREIEQHVTADMLIEDLDVDSLEFIELVQQISERFGPVPDEKIKKLCTVRDLFEASQTSAVQH